MAPKSMRFADLVKTCGKPTVLTLWTAPQNDRSFMQAVKENRVLTILQEPTSKKKDAGQIGFYEKAYSSYLVFPRPLPENKAAKVVGLDYDLIEQPAVTDPVTFSAHSKRTKEKPSVPREKTFSVTVRRIAKIETQVSITARNKAEAEKEALKEVEKQPFDVAEALLKNEVRSVDE